MKLNPKHKKQRTTKRKQEITNRKKQRDTRV